MSEDIYWSTKDPCAGVRTLLKHCNGDMDKALKKLFAPPCSWVMARQMSIALAHCFELTTVEFIRKFRELR
jgi:predicted oxidoreductase (fatty acid repression mutant protein)